MRLPARRPTGRTIVCWSSAKTTAVAAAATRSDHSSSVMEKATIESRRGFSETSTSTTSKPSLP